MTTKIQNRLVRRRYRKGFPIGSLTALLTGSLAALIGVCSGLEPFVISYRSFISALLLGTIVTIGTSIVQLANVQRPKRDSAPSGDT